MLFEENDPQSPDMYTCSLYARSSCPVCCHRGCQLYRKPTVIPLRINNPGRMIPRGWIHLILISVDTLATFGGAMTLPSWGRRNNVAVKTSVKEQWMRGGRGEGGLRTGSELCVRLCSWWRAIYWRKRIYILVEPLWSWDLHRGDNSRLLKWHSVGRLAEARNVRGQTWQLELCISHTLSKEGWKRRGQERSGRTHTNTNSGTNLTHTRKWREARQWKYCKYKARRPLWRGRYRAAHTQSRWLTLTTKQSKQQNNKTLRR